MRRGKRLRAQKHKSTRPSKHEHMLVEMQTSTRAQRYLSTRGPECKSTNTRVHDHRSPDTEHQATVTKAEKHERTIVAGAWGHKIAKPWIRAERCNAHTAHSHAATKAQRYKTKIA